MRNTKFFTLEEIKDRHIGKIGTPRRDKYEADLQSFLVGEAIKQARKSQNMTQEELAQRIGVQRAQVSKIESGKNLTLSPIARVFKAMIRGILESFGLGKHSPLTIKKAENPHSRVVLRSGNNANANSGLAYANANSACSYSGTSFGARLNLLRLKSCDPAWQRDCRRIPRRV